MKESTTRTLESKKDKRMTEGRKESQITQLSLGVERIIGLLAERG
jgi:hypothetical protein